MVKLIKANIHKDRAVLIAFLLIIILSTLLLHTGLFVNGYGKLYDDKAREAELTDAVIFSTGSDQEIDQVLKSEKLLEEYSITDVIMPEVVNLTTDQNEKEKSQEYGVFYRLEDYDSSKEITFLERDERVSGNKIYLNLYTAYSNNLRVGDKLYLSMGNLGDYEYTVAGIYEDLLNGNTYTCVSFLLGAKEYQALEEKADKLLESGTEYDGRKMILCRFADETKLSTGFRSVSDGLQDAGLAVYGYTREQTRTIYISIVNIIAAFMTAFSVIIMGICLIMIIFTINNNIDRDIINIGALRAVGHTTGQVREALILEFLLLGAVGTGTGIILSYSLFPLLEHAFFREITGLEWQNGFSPMNTALVFGGVLAAIVIVTLLSTRKIKHLHPATALRFGLSANSFKKNHLPLDRAKGGLNLLLAVKSALQAPGQNGIILGILLAVSFVTIFSGVLFYNTRIDSTNFQRLIQGDVPDAIVTIRSEAEEERYAIIEQLQEIDGVSQVYNLQTSTASIDGNDATLLYVSRPEYVYCGVYEGEMIREDNEAVLGGVLAEEINAKIGDEVVIEWGGNRAAFLVTGLQQAVYGFGTRIYLTDGGAKRLGIETNHSEINYQDIRIRLTEPGEENVNRVLREAERLLGDTCISTQNYYKYQRSNENMPVYAVSFIILLLEILNIVTVVVVIRLLLKTVFIKREKEFGIKKAVGFTSGQLRLQLSLSLLPVSILAALLGAVLGYFFINPLIALIFSGYGIMNADLIVSPVLIVITMGCVTLLVCVLGYVMSGRMKRVSAYQFIQE